MDKLEERDYFWLLYNLFEFDPGSLEVENILSFSTQYSFLSNLQTKNYSIIQILLNNIHKY